MEKPKLIEDIKGRFSLEKPDFKSLKPYELSMIYDIYPNISEEYINEAILEYTKGFIKIQRNKNFHNDNNSFDNETYGRGVFKNNNNI